MGYDYGQLEFNFQFYFVFWVSGFGNCYTQLFDNV